MTLQTANDVISAARRLRDKLEHSFQADTSLSWRPAVPSTGHCAAVSIITHIVLGGQFVSAHVEGVSHWFNRVPTTQGDIDLDLTADQFGRKRVETGSVNELWPVTRVRDWSEIRSETLARARLLAEGAGIPEVDAFLTSLIHSTTLS